MAFILPELTIKEWYTVKAGLDSAIQTYRELSVKRGLPERTLKQFAEQADDAQAIYDKITAFIG